MSRKQIQDENFTPMKRELLEFFYQQVILPQKTCFSLRTTVKVFLADRQQETAVLSRSLQGMLGYALKKYLNAGMITHHSLHSFRIDFERYSPADFEGLLHDRSTSRNHGDKIQIPIRIPS